MKRKIVVWIQIIKIIIRWIEWQQKQDCIIIIIKVTTTEVDSPMDFHEYHVNNKENKRRKNEKSDDESVDEGDDSNEDLTTNKSPFWKNNYTRR